SAISHAAVVKSGRPALIKVTIPSNPFNLEYNHVRLHVRKRGARLVLCPWTSDYDVTRYTTPFREDVFLLFRCNCVMMRLDEQNLRRHLHCYGGLRDLIHDSLPFRSSGSR